MNIKNGVANARGSQSSRRIDDGASATVAEFSQHRVAWTSVTVSMKPTHTCTRARARPKESERDICVMSTYIYILRSFPSCSRQSIVSKHNKELDLHSPSPLRRPYLPFVPVWEKANRSSLWLFFEFPIAMYDSLNAPTTILRCMCNSISFFTLIYQVYNVSHRSYLCDLSMCYLWNLWRCRDGH